MLSARLVVRYLECRVKNTEQLFAGFTLTGLVGKHQTTSLGLLLVESLTGTANLKNTTSGNGVRSAAKNATKQRRAYMDNYDFYITVGCLPEQYPDDIETEDDYWNDIEEKEEHDHVYEW
jgi:hypothetical protein